MGNFTLEITTKKSSLLSINSEGSSITSASSNKSSPRLISPVLSVGIKLTFKNPYDPLSPTIVTLEGASIRYPKERSFKNPCPISYYSGGSQKGSSLILSSGIWFVSKYLSNKSLII